MHAIEEEYLTVTEAASLLRVAPSTIRRWIREGDVPAYRVGRRRVALRRHDLSRLITPARPSAERSTFNLAGDEPKEIRQLTPEEKQQAREAMDRARRHAEETQARRGGRLFRPAWEDLAELRDERTRELS